MKIKKRLLFIFLPLILIGMGIACQHFHSRQLISGAPPYGESMDEVPELNTPFWLSNWQRPDGPVKIALQVGHWKNEELPDELEKLKGSSTGSKGGGYNEWEVNLAIAQKTAEILADKGLAVEILPATVPPSFWADVFLAVHADGSADPSKSGFKIASPWRDFGGRADSLVAFLYESYGQATGLIKDENITRNMRGYYAFSWWRYQHAVHPMTTSAIVETGFLTNYSDRKIIVSQPEIVAQGIARGILNYLKGQNLPALND